MVDTQKPITTPETHFDSANQSLAEEKQPIAPPMAMAELEIMKADNAKSVASKNPEVRNIALLFSILLGVTLLSQIISYSIVQSFNATQTNFLSAFIASNGIFGIVLLLAEIIAVFALFFTRKTSHAKIIILAAGIGFGISLLGGIFSFQIGPAIITNSTILVVNFLILGKIFKTYLDL